MNKVWVFTAVFLVLLVSGTCDSSTLHRIRKLTANERSNVTDVQQVSPVPSPDTGRNANSSKAAELGTGRSNHSDTSNGTVSVDPIGSKRNETHNEGSGALLSPAGEKNISAVTENETKASENAAENSENSSATGSKESSNPTAKITDDKGSCNRSLASCKDQGLLACIETLGDRGPKQIFLVVLNEKESTLKVRVSLPDHMIDRLPELEVAAGEARKVDISSKVANSSTIVLTSGNSKCVLHLARPGSAFSLMQQLSLQYMQATPIFAVYAAGGLVLVFGGIVACCMIRRRKKKNEIPYQELEMGLPESSVFVPVNTAEGWDDEWDNDDWNDDNAVRSPAAPSRPANGVTSRSAKGGWETDWED